MRKMKLAVAVCLISLLIITGCASESASKFAGYFWKYRDNFVHRNDALTPLNKETALHAAGSVLGIDEAAITAELKEKAEK